MTSKARIYQRKWRKAHPGYERDCMRRLRERRGHVIVQLLGVRCDLRSLVKARAAAEFIFLTGGL